MKKNKYLRPLLTLLSGFAFYILTILPELITYNGVLIFNGDYSMQLVPFYYHFHDCILSGNLVWDFSTGYGEQFLSSYAYYNLFSPFTAIFLIIPRNLIIYFIPYVSALKYGTGAMLGYFYAKRFLKNENYAVLAGFLYMFSSASAYNVVFHFEDVIAFFPLILIGLEELCVNGRRGAFALTAAFLAILNYYFFFGEAVFTVIYFFARGICDKSFGLSFKKFISVAIEAVIGILSVMVVLFPVAVTLLESSKATGLIEPSDMFVYGDFFVYLKIIQSAFMIPDIFSYVSFFPDYSVEYPFGTISASVAAYIPLFSLTGVISYIVRKKKSWESVLLIICSVMALVPVLNQLFSGLNSGYYARWFFMPLLIGVLVTVKALEENISFKPGIITCGGVLGAIILYRIFVNTERLAMYNSPRSFYNEGINIVNLAISAISILLVIVVVKLKRDKEYFPKLFIISVIGIYMCYGFMCYNQLVGYDDKHGFVSRYEFGTPQTIKTADGERISIPRSTKNKNLIWGYNATTFFNSLHDSGFSEFIAANELVLDSGLTEAIDITAPELLNFSSVRYIFGKDGEKEYFDVEGDYVGDFGNHKVYENPNYLPLGIAYDSMITYDNFMSLEKEQKHRANLKYVVVRDTEEFSDILTLCEQEGDISDDEYDGIIEAHKAESSKNIKLYNDGLSVETDIKTDKVLVFTVSHNKGWKAYIDGEETEVYNVNNGLIGIKAPAGQHEIRLKYTIRGLETGSVISLIGIASFVIYILICGRNKKVLTKQL